MLFPYMCDAEYSSGFGWRGVPVMGLMEAYFLEMCRHWDRNGIARPVLDVESVQHCAYFNLVVSAVRVSLRDLRFRGLVLYIAVKNLDFSAGAGWYGTPSSTAIIVSPG